jgi:hypothetical protein
VQHANRANRPRIRSPQRAQRDPDDRDHAFGDRRHYPTHAGRCPDAAAQQHHHPRSPSAGVPPPAATGNPTGRSATGGHSRVATGKGVATGKVTCRLCRTHHPTGSWHPRPRRHDDSDGHRYMGPEHIIVQTAFIRFHFFGPRSTILDSQSLARRLNAELNPQPRMCANPDGSRPISSSRGCRLEDFGRDGARRRREATCHAALGNGECGRR